MFNMTKTTRTAIAGALAFAALTAGTAGAFAADKFSREVTLVNDYNAPMMYFYATPSTNQTWGDDHLKEYVVEPGWQITIDVSDSTGYCTFDLRAEFSDGSVDEMWSVNICEQNQITYYQM
jgi:hypothetical protein